MAAEGIAKRRSLTQYDGKYPTNNPSSNMFPEPYNFQSTASTINCDLIHKIVCQGSKDICFDFSPWKSESRDRNSYKDF